jgi:DNA-binding transcriptional MerR regulator
MCRAACTTRRGVKYYEEEGLFGPVEKSTGGTRRFTPEQLNRGKIIAAGKFGGWSLDEIKAMIEEWGPEVHEALTTRLADQAAAAARLIEALPVPPSKPVVTEYDL